MLLRNFTTSVVRVSVILSSPIGVEGSVEIDSDGNEGSKKD